EELKQSSLGGWPNAALQRSIAADQTVSAPGQIAARRQLVGAAQAYGLHQPGHAVDRDCTGLLVGNAGLLSAGNGRLNGKYGRDERRKRTRKVHRNHVLSNGTSVATAWAAMPSPRPVKPSRSVVVAFTLTASI